MALLGTSLLIWVNYHHRMAASNVDFVTDMGFYQHYGQC